MATIVSNGTGGGLWSDTATWSGSATPTITDSVVIKSTDTVTIDHDAFTLNGSVHELKAGGDGRNVTGVTAYARASTDRIEKTAHGLTAGTQLEFTGTTAGPVILQKTPYYVLDADPAGDGNSFTISLTVGGSQALFTSDGTAVVYQVNTVSIANYGITQILPDIGSSGDFYEIIHQGEYWIAGTDKIGTSATPLLSDRKITHRLNYSGTLTIGRYTLKTSTGTGSNLLYYGASKTTLTYLNGAVTATTNPTIVVDEATNWKIGDVVTISDGYSTTKTETFTISSVTGTTIGLTGTLAANKADNAGVLNTSANIIFKSYDITKQTSILIQQSNNLYNNVFRWVSLHNLGTGSAIPSISASAGSMSLTDRPIILSYGNNYNLILGFVNFELWAGSTSTSDFVVQNASGGFLFDTYINFASVHLGAASYCTSIKINKYYCYSASSGNAIGATIINFQINEMYVEGCNNGITGNPMYLKINKLTCVKCSTGIQSAVSLKIKDFICKDNGYDINLSGGNSIESIIIENYSSTGATTANIGSGLFYKIFISNYLGVVGYNRTIHMGSILESDVNIFRTTAPSAKTIVFPTNNVAYPIDMSAQSRTAYVNANKTITLTCWVMRDIISASAEARLRIGFGTDGRGLLDSPTTEHDIMPNTSATVIVTFDGSTNLVTKTAHGLSVGDTIRLSGATLYNGGSLPTGLTAGTTYYVRNVSTDTFQLATTNSDGTIIDFTGNGSGINYLTKLLVFSSSSGLMATCSNHGFVNGQKVIFGGGTLPTGLVSNASYYIANATTNTFKISSTSDGLNLVAYTNAGTAPLYCNAWEQKTLNLGTTTSAGFINLELMLVRGASTWNLWIDDITITETTP